MTLVDRFICEVVESEAAVAYVPFYKIKKILFSMGSELVLPRTTLFGQSKNWPVILCKLGSMSAFYRYFIEKYSYAWTLKPTAKSVKREIYRNRKPIFLLWMYCRYKYNHLLFADYPDPPSAEMIFKDVFFLCPTA